MRYLDYTFVTEVFKLHPEGITAASVIDISGGQD
jgi:hypothetical protein